MKGRMNWQQRVITSGRTLARAMAVYFSYRLAQSSGCGSTCRLILPLYFCLTCLISSSLKASVVGVPTSLV